MRALIAATMLAATAGAAGAQPPLAQLSWLAGCWKAAGAEQGSGEQWTPPAGGSMLGSSRTIRQGKLLEFEFMQLRTLDDGTLAFIAQPSGSPPTTFRLKTLDATGATFENPGHDFPQRVIYAQAGTDGMLARIEGVINGVPRSVSFPMMRVDCTVHFKPARN